MEIQEIEKIYRAFRKAKAESQGTMHRLPKDFEKALNKLTEKNRKNLIKITGWFMTKWTNIDPYTYFKCGFDLIGKNFSYVRFFNKKILMLYISRDKIQKRNTRIDKEKLIKSAKFLKKYMRDNEIRTILEYVNKTDGNRKIAINHFLKNFIDPAFFVFLMRKGLTLTEDDRGYLPYISKNYRVLNLKLNDLESFLYKIEEVICQQNTKEI
jgi:hypothetical protein